jgi:hypothetical protein
MKLSERLELMLTARLTDEDSIIREAMELAKRYEDAPVATFFWGDPSELILAAEHLSGQRVRILLDTEGV